MAERPTAHTFEQVNWENAEEETRIGVLQEMVAILLNRLDEYVAAPAVTDLARVYEDGMRAGIIAGRAGQEFDDVLAEVNRLVDSADTNATADAIRALARLSESVPEGEPRE